MLTKSDVYNCLDREDPETFKARMILRNAARIESGEMPVHEILRQTGRTDRLAVEAITLLSVGAKIAIYAHNHQYGRYIKARIDVMAEEVMKKTGHFIPIKNLIMTTPYSLTDLIGHTIDVSLYDDAIRDQKMRKTGMYE